jgi:hypothetical protein
MPSDLTGPYATTTADLAAAYAEQGDVDRATELLLEALDLVEVSELVIGITVIRGVRTIHIRSDAPQVKRLDERLHSLHF